MALTWLLPHYAAHSAARQNQELAVAPSEETSAVAAATVIAELAAGASVSSRQSQG